MHNDDAAQTAADTLATHAAVDVDERRALLEANGHTGFKGDAEALTAEAPMRWARWSADGGAIAPASKLA